MNIYFSHITPRSHVDGPGERTVIFLQGCTLACPGCQNRHLWKAEDGKLTRVEDLAFTAALLAGQGGQVTISGGEPFQQPRALADLVEALRERGVKHILVYSGYTWDELNNPVSGLWLPIQRALHRIDILVDGRFQAQNDDPFLTWRGSRNQRPIDVPATLAAGEVVTLDWDTPDILITENGDLLMPLGMAEAFESVGTPADTRRCGQTR